MIGAKMVCLSAGWRVVTFSETGKVRVLNGDWEEFLFSLEPVPSRYPCYSQMQIFGGQLNLQILKPKRDI